MRVPARRARGWTAGAALACLAVLAAACGHSSAPAASATVTVTASPSAPSHAAPTATATPSARANVAACPTLSLQVKLGAAQGAAGSTYRALDFVNISDVTCTLFGYPGVSLASGSPITQIGRAADESHAAPRQLVTLAPHAVANALLRIVNAGNFPVATCQPTTAHSLQVFPPNQTAAIYVSYTTQTCAKPVRILTIGVVQPGPGSAG
jgi:hypothetical protein